MKTKLLFLSLFMLLSLSSRAQTDKQRDEIKKEINQVELTKLQEKYQAQFEKDEIEINNYLAANPDKKRTFEKDGSIYKIARIDSNGKPIYINTKNIDSGILIKANSLYSGGSLGVDITGTGMVAGVWDGGQVRATHELLSGKVTMQAGQSVTSAGGDNHMTHVSGTMVGKEIAGNTARGIAYNATAQNYDWDNDLAEMTSFAGNGFLISNHSYGLGNGPGQDEWTFGAYDSTAQQWDALLKTTPNYLPFVAGGNEQQSNGSGKTGPDQGYDVITGSSAAKNVVTVGAVGAVDQFGVITDVRGMSDYSNFGPTDDGRIKPDICARGTGINSSYATADNAYSGNGSNSSGTSYASPAAAAAALLLQQYYYSLNNSYMNASMLKALLLHSADDEGAAGPDMKFGWGILNIERAAQIIKDDKTTNKAKMYTFTTNPTNNGSSEISISGNGTTNTNTGVGTGELKASICWTDDEGVEQTVTDGTDPTAKRLVYNFSFAFRRLAPFAQNYPYKEFTMATRTDVATLGSDFFQNNTDNFKQTFIPAGGTEGGSYTLYVRKSSSSPAAVRNISVIITGLALNVNNTLSTTEFEDAKNFVFYNNSDNKLKLISNNNDTFGTYSIYDISGKTIQNGKSTSNEIEMNNNATGVYILNFESNGNTQSLKFIIK